MYEVEWLLDCQPREVQLEALRRSYYGYALRDHKDDEPNPRRLWTRPDEKYFFNAPIGPANGKLRDGPAKTWAHFLEMRLGKTPTLLNEFLLLRKYQGLTRLVVLSPNTYKQDWVNEVAKFGLDVAAFGYETPDKKATAAFLKKMPEEFVVVVNYEGLIYNDTAAFLKKIVDKNTLVVADESIKIKNPDSLSSKAAQLASLGTEWVRILTGLPMTQGPQDLFSQLRFLRAAPGQNFYSFRNTFCRMGGFKNKKIVGAKNEELLQSILNVNSFVAKRRDWTNVTTPEYYTVDTLMNPEQRKFYDEMNRDFITVVDGMDAPVTASQVITQMMKLQQISSGFLYDENGNAHEIVPPEKTAKMLMLISMLEDEVPGKVVVPYHYSKSGEALMTALTKYSPAIICSGVRMKAMNRDVVAEKRKFNNGEGDCRVMLLQISAGKYGHDLSGIKGDRTSYMMFYENTYSLDDRTQIEARITSGDNQDWSAVYMDFVNSQVEKKPIKALQKKEDVVSSIMGAYQLNKTRDTITYDFKKAPA